MRFRLLRTVFFTVLPFTATRLPCGALHFVSPPCCAAALSTPPSSVFRAAPPARCVCSHSSHVLHPCRVISRHLTPLRCLLVAVQRAVFPALLVQPSSSFVLSSCVCAARPLMLFHRFPCPSCFRRSEPQLSCCCSPLLALPLLLASRSLAPFLGARVPNGHVAVASTTETPTCARSFATLPSVGSVHRDRVHRDRLPRDTSL